MRAAVPFNGPWSTISSMCIDGIRKDKTGEPTSRANGLSAGPPMLTDNSQNCYPELLTKLLNIAPHPAGDRT